MAHSGYFVSAQEYAELQRSGSGASRVPINELPTELAECD